VTCSYSTIPGMGRRLSMSTAMSPTEKTKPFALTTSQPQA